MKKKSKNITENKIKFQKLIDNKNFDVNLIFFNFIEK